MRLYSTKSPNSYVSLKDAVLKGLPDDNGLYMPEHITRLPPSFLNKLKEHSFQAIGFEICRNLFNGEIPEKDLKSIIDISVNFPAPLIGLDDYTYVLELFHGPTLAFKDFGARFMAQLMSYFNRDNDKELIILVATSGDTGGAVAAGFHKTPGIRIVILYPSGKVSHLQEKQLTTLGDNVTALEVNGSFDDCQALVKAAFLDKDLNQKLRLSSANSINISRLIPQSFYYFEAFKQLPHTKDPVVFSVPSGNFGNLTAGLFAKKMGLPIHQFIAATNINDVVPAYLQTGQYQPRPSTPTLSNAMDVGNPSNFARILDLYSSTWNTINTEIKGYSFTDTQTRDAISSAKHAYDYIFDPHGAIGILALQSYHSQQKAAGRSRGIILETAHPSKFLTDVEQVLGEKIKIPERLAVLKNKNKQSIYMETDFIKFKEWLSLNF